MRLPDFDTSILTPTPQVRGYGFAIHWNVSPENTIRLTVGPLRIAILRKYGHAPIVLTLVVQWCQTRRV